MNKKQKEVQQAILDTEKEVLEQLKKNYQDALDEINTKIAILRGRSDADMTQVMYQVVYQEALKKQVESALNTLQANEFETISDYLAKSYENGYIGTMYDIQNQGIPIIMPMDQEQIVQAIQHETKLSEGLYKALGKDVKVLSKQIAGEITRGISSGQMYSEIARNIAGYAGISRNKAMRIARTEGHRIQCRATMDAQFKAKEKGADVVKQWDSYLDKRTRSTHRKLDGQIRELDEEFEVNGNFAMMPGGFNKASEDINCRCALLQRARWALDEEELETLKKRAEYFKLDKAEDFADYKKKYLKAVEEERVRLSPQKTKGKVVELSEYTVDGITYKVDGKHILLDNTEHEKEVAELISKELGEEVSLIPRVVYPQGISTPDYIINNKRYDLKEPTGSGKNVLYNMIHKKKSQADNFIFDITNCPLDYDAITEQVEGIFSSTHTTFVSSIIIIKDGKVKEQFHRNKKRNQ